MSDDKKPAPPHTTTHTDEEGQRVTTTHFSLSADTVRPLRDEVVAAYDAALDALGHDVMHAIDPARMLDFPHGGPSVWSVAAVSIDAPRHYTLLLTYGFSHVLSPADYRQAFSNEYSIAIPADQDATPWLLLLRHACHYVLATGSELRVDDVMPCYESINRLPFSDEEKEQIEETPLVGLVVARDPVLPTIATPHGEVEVRRLYGVHQRELDRIETSQPSSFTEEFAKFDPSLITDPSRDDLMDHPALRDTLDARAREEGSSVPAILCDVDWDVDEDYLLTISFPGGEQAQKLLDAIHGRLPFGRALNVFSPGGMIVRFEPGEFFDIRFEENAVILAGAIDELPFDVVLRSIDPSSETGHSLTFQGEE